MTRRLLATAILGLAASLLVPATAGAQSLRGSKASLDRQNGQARSHDFSYLSSGRQLQGFVEAGLLVPLTGNGNYRLKGVSFAYARPEVRLFAERLASQFRAACGELLVVTSLVRPKSSQPRNASLRSVHPTGMALDIRRHNTPACRVWLERVLLSLESKQVLEVTLERNPPHYHVALFPKPYAAYVARLTGARQSGLSQLVTYTVSRNDTLWRIARRHGTTPEQIQAANKLSSTLIYLGQALQVPVISRQR